MKLNELSDAKKLAIKWCILCATHAVVSRKAIQNADDIVSDDELAKYFGSTDFADKDFISYIEDDGTENAEYMRYNKTKWESKDGHLVMNVSGDPRINETVEFELLKDGVKVASWSQDFTDEDDDGEPMNWTYYYPWGEKMYYDIIDAGCDDIPEDIDMIEVDWKKVQKSEVQV